jgi:heme/copper-type cytochrome/quinol oxidase subunit 2
VAADLRGDLLGAKAHLKSDWALWTGILVPPLAWASDETLSYSLVKWACNHHSTTSIQVVTFATLVVIAAAGLIGWRAQRERGIETETERAEFMAMLSAMNTVFFIVVTIAMAIPKWALHNVCV